MRVLLQRVARASVALPSGETRAIGRGLLVYLGVGVNDASEHAQKLADKIVALRVFSNAEGKFDRSVFDERGELLVISQFTLFGSVQSGRRPDFTSAARPALARPLYERFVEALKGSGLTVKTGEFAAHMSVESVNDGPVTIWLDSERL